MSVLFGAVLGRGDSTGASDGEGSGLDGGSVSSGAP